VIPGRGGCHTGLTASRAYVREETSRAEGECPPIGKFMTVQGRGYISSTQGEPIRFWCCYMAMGL
jgi:hypothetical protein